MRLLALLILFIFSASCNRQREADIKEANIMENEIAIAIHGGAGDLKSMQLTPEQEKAYKETLSQALDAGYAVLKSGGSSVLAVETAVRILEDSPLFNAGKGSVFTNDSTNEMDAAIMDGKTLNCGAVTCVTTIKNPISAARLVMDSSEFVFLSGAGAEKFAEEHRLEIVDRSYFCTARRMEQYQKHKETGSLSLDHDNKQTASAKITDEKSGTVGCVALDKSGNLAAATSTGGIVNKKYNRIGDSPIIGAGTYANNKTCAVSCTGRGEYFIRLVAAHEVSALMLYQDYSLKDAVQKVLEQLKELEGKGGMIAIDHKGNICMDFTTSGMFRGVIDRKGNKEVDIYAGEE